MKKQNMCNYGSNETEIIYSDSVACSMLRYSGPAPACRYLESDQTYNCSWIKKSIMCHGDLLHE